MAQALGPTAITAVGQTFQYLFNKKTSDPAAMVLTNNSLSTILVQTFLKPYILNPAETNRFDLSPQDIRNGVTLSVTQSAGASQGSVLGFAYSGSELDNIPARTFASQALSLPAAHSFQLQTLNLTASGTTVPTVGATNIGFELYNSTGGDFWLTPTTFVGTQGVNTGIPVFNGGYYFNDEWAVGTSINIFSTVTLANWRGLNLIVQ